MGRHRQTLAEFELRQYTPGAQPCTLQEPCCNFALPSAVQDWQESYLTAETMAASYNTLLLSAKESLDRKRYDGCIEHCQKAIRSGMKPHDAYLCAQALCCYLPAELKWVLGQGGSQGRRQQYAAVAKDVSSCPPQRRLGLRIELGLLALSHRFRETEHRRECSRPSSDCPGISNPILVRAGAARMQTKGQTCLWSLPAGGAQWSCGQTVGIPRGAWHCSEQNRTAG